MKQCAHCKEVKELSEFAWNNKTLQKRQKHCRDCMRKFNRASYKRRSEKRKKEIYQDKLKRIEVAQQYVWDYLSNHPCVNCGITNPIVLEFDHIKGKKRRAVSDMARLGYSIESIQKEIDKCQVLCANCHREKTHRERGWFSG